MVSLVIARDLCDVRLSESPGGSRRTSEDGGDAGAERRHAGTARSDHQRTDARSHAIPGARLRVPHSAQHGRQILPGSFQGLNVGVMRHCRVV